ncbi:MAG: S4 domain-containing protein [Thermaerobacter sp.]|nr:S4 domain-containing protein [Thermaerobacter sp.]
MRLDKFLKVSRLIKRRTLAKEACTSGRIELNGRVAKAGSEVAPGDCLSLRFGGRRLVVEVVEVREAVPQAKAPELYRVLEESREE